MRSKCVSLRLDFPGELHSEQNPGVLNSFGVRVCTHPPGNHVLGSQLHRGRHFRLQLRDLVPLKCDLVSLLLARGARSVQLVRQGGVRGREMGGLGMGGRDRVRVSVNLLLQLLDLILLLVAGIPGAIELGRLLLLRSGRHGSLSEDM